MLEIAEAFDLANGKLLCFDEINIIFTIFNVTKTLSYYMFYKVFKKTQQKYKGDANANL